MALTIYIIGNLQILLKMKNIILIFILTISFTQAQNIIYNKNPANIFTNFATAASEELDVLHYGLELKIAPAITHLRAKATITSRLDRNISESLSFDFSGLVADSAFIDGEKVSFLQTTGQISLIPGRILHSGDSVRAEIYYQGTPQRGLYFRQNSRGETVVYSHNEPFDARYWFPCKDDPADKALLDIYISLPENYVALSNGSLITEKHMLENSEKMSYWQENYPIATYLISLAAAPYKIITEIYQWQNERFPLQYYVYDGDQQRAGNALEWTAQMMDFFNLYIGSYPFYAEKYAMSAVPLREAAAMENQTATTMRDNEIDNEGIIAHELAHQWWGDALTPRTFSHIWLNEGFASYFDALFTEHKYGTAAFLQQMNLYRTYINQDGSLEYPILDPPPEFLFGRAVYFKGAWVLHMLRDQLGDTVFNQVIRAYFSQFNYSNVTTDDLILISELVSGQSLQVFFDQWLNYGGMPILDAQFAEANDQLNLTITQRQAEPLYRLDLEILISRGEIDTLCVVGIEDRTASLTIPFQGTPEKIVIDPQNRILQTNNTPLYFTPQNAQLMRLFPNPFNEEIIIEFATDRNQQLSIALFNVHGEKVATVANKRFQTGLHSVAWDGSNQASGTYFVCLQAGSVRDVKKILLLK